MNAQNRASEKPNPKNMKTLLLTTLTFTGLAFCPTEAQAKSHKHHSNETYRCERPSHHYSYYREDCGPRVSYSRSYYRPVSHYYYRPAPRYSYSDRCYTEHRHSFRSPLISFLFGF